jgi:PAS domain-containing protein
MPQKDIVLILARDLAEHLASAMFVVDGEGTLVYFNEAAAEMLGRSFAEVGEIPLAEWSRAFEPQDFDGRPLAPDDLPLVVAVREHHPAHRTFRIQGADGASRDLAVTAIPLFARREEFVGASAVFWEHATAGPDEANGDH